MRLILVIYITTLIIKLLAYFFSSVTAIFADALHSVVDIVLLLILATASRASERKPDHLHPMGHGLIKNIASLAISVAFITVLAFELFREGINKILNPAESYPNLEIALIAEFLVLGLLMFATVLYWRRKGVVSRTVMFESLNDSLSTLAAIIGIFAIFGGYMVFDGIATIVIALLIAFNSIKLFVENAKFLVGLSPPEEFYNEIENFCQNKGIKGVHDMVALYMDEGAIHLDMHVTVEGRMSVEKADELIEELAEELKRNFPNIRHVSIHLCSHKGDRRKIY
ncbi:MAG: cation diffusion facilitator family transporter [Archaeoglobaceae archaeon]|nr:cation diffusion facilitator family transporter [Archaeoglobaceae archaeon]MDW8117572.1 cation diffusion facilitator family transporter [Archaeoglobaceae archaeon]